MNSDKEKQIWKYYEKNLSIKRQRHIRGVIESAEKLAEKYGGDKEKVHTAALLHDYAKGQTPDEMKYCLIENNVLLDDIQMRCDSLLHSLVAVVVAFKEYGISDIDILNSIRYHTTGRKNMSINEKIVCLADYIEKNRNFDGVEKIREKAEKDIDLALKTAFDGTIRSLLNKGELIHPDTLAARNELLIITENKQK